MPTVSFLNTINLDDGWKAVVFLFLILWIIQVLFWRLLEVVALIKHCKTRFLINPLLSKNIYLFNNILHPWMWFFILHSRNYRKAQDQHLLVAPVLFCYFKISLNNFTDRVTNLISVVSVRAKRGKNLHALTTFTGRRWDYVPFFIWKSNKITVWLSYP